MTTINDLHAQLIDRIEELVSGEDWERMLAASRKFHTYSAANVLLILGQRPEATHVAGYTTWAKLGRQVRKGARGMAILAPCSYKPETDADEEPRRVLRGFRVAHVFDVADTDGEELPDVRPEQLLGDDPDGLWDSLAGLIHEYGFELSRSDCSPANGVTNYSTRRVTVRPDLSAAQSVKTLCHELAHIASGHEAFRADQRDIAEVEAESVAYLICGTKGLETGDYSLPYVARWAHGDPNIVRSTADRVLRTTRDLMARITAARTVEAAV